MAEQPSMTVDRSEKALSISRIATYVPDDLGLLQDVDHVQMSYRNHVTKVKLADAIKRAWHMRKAD